MKTLAEIQEAIRNLPPGQVEELAVWITSNRSRRPPSKEAVEKWLKWAVGAAKPGVTTDEIMRLTRGEE